MLEMGIIYCYTNKINNKKYVGQTRFPNRRKREHFSMALNECSDSVFHKAIRKYGRKNFEYCILEKGSSKELDNLEQIWIDKMDSFIPNGYNMTLGGNGLNGYKAPLETFTCEYCNEEYQSAEGKQGNRWCSEICKYNHDRETGRRDVNGICIVCEKEYTRYRSLRSNVCSLECAVIRDTETFKCKHCGKEYKAVNKGNNMYCSDNCKTLSRYHSGRGRVDRECPVCNNIFKVIKSKKQETCSRGCANRLRKIRADKKLLKQ